MTVSETPATNIAVVPPRRSEWPEIFFVSRPTLQDICFSHWQNELGVREARESREEVKKGSSGSRGDVKKAM